MDAQIQVQSDDFEVNSAQRNSSYSEESESMFQIVQKQKNNKGKGKQKQEKPIIKKVIKKRDIVKKINQQIQDKNITSNNYQMIKKKQNNFSNKFDEYFAEVFDDNDQDLSINNKEKDQINQDIIQNQVQNQLNKIEKDHNNSIQQQPQKEQIKINEIQQQNQLPNYLNNTGQFQYLRMALLKENKHQPILFKRFLNYLQMTQEEYDNIKQSFPDIPSEYLPQVILEQRQINKVHQNKQPQQQQNNQFLWNHQQQQQQFQNNQFYQNQQEIQQQNYIEIEFIFNPNLSEGNLECAICAQTYINGDKLAILRCIHRFHLICFTSWLKKSTQCPICYHG